MKIRNYIIIISILILTILLIKVTKLAEYSYTDPEVEYPHNYRNRSLNIIVPIEHKEKYKRLTEIENLLKLQPLIYSKDSLAIRVWFLPSLIPVKYLVEMKSNENKWEGKLFIIKSDNKNNNEIIEKSKQPINGWDKLINKLNYYGIFTLPDFNKIATEISVEDGMSYWIEVLNERYYRFYTYNNPGSYSEESYECFYFNEIILLLEDKFEIVEKVYL